MNEHNQGVPLLFSRILANKIIIIVSYIRFIQAACHAPMRRGREQS